MLNQHFNLVKPRSMGWGKLKVDMGMALEPAIVFGFVGIEIVENDSMPSRNSLDSAGLQTLRVIQKTLQCLIGYLLGPGFR